MSETELDGLVTAKADVLVETEGDCEDKPGERDGVDVCDVIGEEVGLSGAGDVVEAVTIGTADGVTVPGAGDGEYETLASEQAGGDSPSKNANVSEFDFPPPRVVLPEPIHIAELHPMMPVPCAGESMSGSGAKTPFSCSASTSSQARLSPSPAATTMVSLNTVVVVPPLGRVKSGNADHIPVEKSYTSTAGSYALKKSSPAVESRPPATYNLSSRTAA